MATYLKGLSLCELRDLYVMNSVGMRGRITNLIEKMTDAEREIVARLGCPVSDMDVLEIGPGQTSPYQYYFATRNRYIGIDIEPIQRQNIVAGLLDDLRNRGVPRAIKTFGRRALGLDRRFDREMCRQLDIPARQGRIMCMDASKMAFEDNSMDVVVSRSVFEHIPDPEQVMAEVARVLRPGGVAHIITHLYTCDSGIHDTRIFSGNRDEIPFWSHLRPQHRDKVRPNSYLNEIRLADYRESFDRTWPGVNHILIEDAPAEQRTALAELRKSGELRDYSDEELLSSALVSIWKKPE
ncbi:methyltransferase domain-containing protein [Tropicibacter sp. S64]|uniref:class I SAM-dependent methyltransferase n=1 Tax=Tropicibacter sp. S64 TaxID=3415122 RepID=UPI003C7A71A9